MAEELCPVCGETSEDCGCLDCERCGNKPLDCLCPEGYDKGPDPYAEADAEDDDEDDEEEGDDDDDNL